MGRRLEGLPGPRGRNRRSGVKTLVLKLEKGREPRWKHEIDGTTNTASSLVFLQAVLPTGKLCYARLLHCTHFRSLQRQDIA